MSEGGKKSLEGLKAIAHKGAEKIDVAAIKEKAVRATEEIGDKAEQIKGAAIVVKEDINEKLTELDRMLESSVTEYNDCYTIMNDKGLKLYMERTRSSDMISIIENLVNSIANKPKNFEDDFIEIETYRKQFTESIEFADRELQAARVAAGGAGAGLAAGASVAFMAPTAAMWIATTFGTASTGAAISTLSGAAATNAALAWLGGGALVAGGGGMAAGNALLALAGPIGWTIAGASLLGSIIILSKKKNKLNKEKNEEIENIKRNIESVKEMDTKISVILESTVTARDNLTDLFMKLSCLHNQNYLSFSDEQKHQLGVLVNTTKVLSSLLSKTISE